MKKRDKNLLAPIDSRMSSALCTYKDKVDRQEAGMEGKRWHELVYISANSYVPFARMTADTVLDRWHLDSRTKGMPEEKMSTAP